MAKIREYTTIEQKSVKWSDTDYVMQRAALEILMASPKTVASTILKESVIVWLQSLKNRLQPKQEWSEEDENRVDQICEDLKCGLINFYANKNVKGLHFDEIIESNIDWLKNKLKYLKPQNKKWKPSKEQMKALKEAVDEHFDIDGGALWHLYEDLKKLREE